jgi:rhodanese-related sulfurtransferase
MPQTYADSIPEGSVIVDLREDPELAVQGEFPNAIRMPMSQIRSRLGELPKDKTLVLACKFVSTTFHAHPPPPPSIATDGPPSPPARVGARGNAAYRLLSQNGYTNILNLSGGAMVFNMFNQPDIYKRFVSTSFF